MATKQRADQTALKLAAERAALEAATAFDGDRVLDLLGCAFMTPG